MHPDIIHVVATTERVVAFTFDDGPDAVYTPQLLDIFREVQGKATFCMVGAQIDRNPEVAAAVHEAGHEIANHTYTHPFLTRIDLDEARKELERTDARIREVTGGEPVRTFRPPYFDANDEVIALANELGYKSLGATNLEARDWDQPGVEHILKHTRDTIVPGSILLFHDGFGDRLQTVEAVRILVRELAHSGYRFVTASELFGLACMGHM